MRGRVALLALLLAGTAACAAPVPGTPAPDPDATCSGNRVIRPDGAHHCYLVPSGFEDVSNRLTVDTTSGNPATHRSGVAVGTTDLIFVSEYPLDRNTSGRTARDLLPLVQPLIDGLAAQSGQPSPPVDFEEVDGAPTLVFTLRNRSSTSRIYTIFRGRVEVSVNCQYADQQAEVERACAEVLSSLRLTA